MERKGRAYLERKENTSVDAGSLDIGMYMCACMHIAKVVCVNDCRLCSLC